jgi:light-harvesting complex 1 beta chain
MAEERKGSLSGLTASEAKEFHRMMMLGFGGFLALTLIAHILIWNWRPWF